MTDENRGSDNRRVAEKLLTQVCHHVGWSWKESGGRQDLRDVMTYDEYIAQQQQAIDEEITKNKAIAQVGNVSRLWHCERLLRGEQKWLP